ncbi:hypothetical protein [Bacillus glycinifermentans]|uniref:hypothetical protein n=1 Tax=Bacillus glycinifermentans TaxID=1664069 RepID=UPI0030C81213
MKKLFELKMHYAAEDEELFAMYAKVTNESSELVDKSIEQIVMQLRKLITGCDVKSSDHTEAAKGIFYATERFHHPVMRVNGKEIRLNRNLKSCGVFWKTGF